MVERWNWNGVQSSGFSQFTSFDSRVFASIRAFSRSNGSNLIRRTDLAESSWNNV
jgi:hypothetical protein